ncbi:hypothetical protein [Polaribacter septentrionalilitoris]|uniref:hypothetical protein n=1 Tax=Polaribacter septentrionalilitoris TaxID=2494657 RepID=UPI00135867C3|nr:hypothetical protein [Polaribacter septentrionalilitoris]
MNDDEIADLMRYSSSNELYIVNKNDRIIKLKCPFKVKAKYNIGGLVKDEIVLVTKVKITRELQSAYIIKNQAYYCHHFVIL